MTVPAAARIGIVKVSATLAGSYTTVADATPDATGWDLPVPMEITRQGDTASRQTSSGFYKPQMVLTGPYDPAEAGMAILITNRSTGAMGVQYLRDGSTGTKCTMIATEWKVSHAPGSDAAKFSVTLVCCDGAAPVAI
jgi:hypothetical protein